MEVSPLRLQEKGSASYPKSHMGSVYEAVFNQVELNRKNFPRQWMTASPSTDEKRSGGGGSDARFAALSQKLDRLLGERNVSQARPSHRGPMARPSEGMKGVTRSAMEGQPPKGEREGRNHAEEVCI